MSLMYDDAARQPDQEPACQIGDPGAPHPGHHVHRGVNYEACSCGQDMGTWSVAFADDPHATAFWDHARCRICGQVGLVWAGEDQP